MWIIRNRKVHKIILCDDSFKRDKNINLMFTYHLRMIKRISAKYIGPSSNSKTNKLLQIEMTYDLYQLVCQFIHRRIDITKVNINFKIIKVKINMRSHRNDDNFDKEKIELLPFLNRIYIIMLLSELFVPITNALFNVQIIKYLNYYTIMWILISIFQI